VGDGRV
jgi:hypothetical protein